MKKICILLALILAMCAMPAFAAEGDAMLGHSETDPIYFNYCFPSGDTLYMVTWDGALYSYRIGDADLTTYSYQAPEGMTGGQEDTLMPFADGGELYALCFTTDYGGEHTAFVGASLERLTIGDDGIIAREKKCDVDWSDLVEYYDEESYPTRPDAVVGVGGKAYVRYYDNAGANAMAAVDLSTGAKKPVDAVGDAYSITPYRDGQLLVQSYSYNTPDVAQLYVLDPADDSATLLSEIAISDYNALQGLAYDAATDTAYCVHAGEIRPVDLTTGEVGEGVTDIPAEAYGSAMSSCVLDGGYYAFCYDGAVIRNLDPSQRAQSKLKINDYSWNESVTNAYYRFSNAHGDISVVLSREYSESEKLVENMMNRDDSIDIYVLSSSSSIYDALYRRGYLMELDGAPKVAELCEEMYPALREQLSTDGHLVALPVYISGSTLGIGTEAMKALGLTIDDIPDDWPGFLDFLSGLEGKVDESSPVLVFYSGMSEESMRYVLFMAIFEDYCRYASFSDTAVSYNSPLLLSLLDKVEKLDYRALGCPSQEELDDEANDERYVEDNRPVLVQTDCGDVIGSIYSDVTPVLMRIESGAPARLVLDTMVAIINPFTKNMDAAVAFMDELAGSLTDVTRYNLIPTLSEPMRGHWNEEALEESRNTLASLNEDLEKAEEIDRQMIEDSIRDIEANIDYLETYGWDISPTMVDWYRAHDDALAIAPFNWLYDASSDDSASGEAWTLISQYSDGQIDAQTLLSGIDRKVQMMLQEGN